MNQSARSYHHGNLRDALIIAAAELIEEHGSLDFSITDAARRAGVSNAAPYRHFRDREDLLDNVRHLAFWGLYESVSRARDGCGFEAGSLDLVIAIGHSYLRYARDKRAFFSLMWEDRGQMTVVREEIDHKLSGFNVLNEAVAAFCHAHGSARSAVDDPLNLATQLWALAHGIATLEINHMLDLFDRAASAERLLTDSTRALLAGVLTERGGRQHRHKAADNPQGQLPLA